MDEIVLQAIAKWPNVPNAYGWLKLDRRGQWWIKGSRVDNPTIRDFIGRNYTCDEEGRWFFQNGPQRVFVELEVTPWVFSLKPGTKHDFVTHTGVAAGDIDWAWTDESGAFILAAEQGVGVVDDRDLASVAACIEVGSGTRPGLVLKLGARTVSIDAITRAQLPKKFKFVANPTAKSDEPEC